MGWIGKAKAGCGRVGCWDERGLGVVHVGRGLEGWEVSFF